MDTVKINSWFKSYISKNVFLSTPHSLKNLSVVIFSFKRPECIIKSSAYWAKKLPKIIIVDGSHKILNKTSRKIIKNINNISYFHLPNRTIPERIKFGINKSKTKFTMCQGDDDFYLSTGLIESIKTLERKKSILACMGQSLGLDFVNKQPYLFEYGNNLKNYNITSKKFSSRLNYAFKNFLSANFYAVYRTKDFKKLWKNIKNLSCQELYEYEHAFRTYLEGSLVTTKKRYWVRSFSNKPKSGKIDGSRKLTASKWLMTKKFNFEKKSLINRLTKAVLKKKFYDKKKSKKFTNYIINLIKDNKKSLYQKNSFIFYFFISIKNILEKSFFSESFNVIKKTNFAIFLIEKLNYLSRNKINISKSLNKIERDEIKKLIEFLKDCPS